MNEEIVTHKVVEFEAEERIKFEADFNRGGWASRKFADGWSIQSYDTDSLPLREGVIGMLTTSSSVSAADIADAGGIEYVHRLIPEAMQVLDKHELNALTRSFYDQPKSFLEIYRAFIKRCIDEVIGEPCLFQKTPTIRAHFPHQKGFNWAPRYHTDIMLGHPPQEINLWIPLTSVYASNSLRVTDMKSSTTIFSNLNYDLAGFAHKVQTDENLQIQLEQGSRSLEMEYGEYVIIDPRCLHAGQNNKTDITRISVDVRVIPLKEYNNLEAQYRGTGRRQVRFERGDYYDERSSDMIE